MKKLTAVLLLTTAGGFIGCEEETRPATPPAMSGSWVEESQRRDTLVFDPTEKWFSLRPVLQIPGQPWRPAGLYQFDLAADSIKLQWMPSSLIPRKPPTYYFRVNAAGNQFTIGNFLQWPNRAQTTLTFRRLP